MEKKYSATHYLATNPAKIKFPLFIFRPAQPHGLQAPASNFEPVPCHQFGVFDTGSSKQVQGASDSHIHSASA